MTLDEAIKLSEQRRAEIVRQEKRERDEMMGAVCRLLDLGGRYQKDPANEQA